MLSKNILLNNIFSYNDFLMIYKLTTSNIMKNTGLYGLKWTKEEVLNFLYYTINVNNLSVKIYYINKFIGLIVYLPNSYITIIISKEYQNKKLSIPIINIYSNFLKKNNKSKIVFSFHKRDIIFQKIVNKLKAKKTQDVNFNRKYNNINYNINILTYEKKLYDIDINNIYLNIINIDDIKYKQKDNYILSLLHYINFNINNITYIDKNYYYHKDIYDFDKIKINMINNKNLKIEYNNNIIGIILINDNNYISIILDKMYIYEYIYIYILKYFITYCNIKKIKKFYLLVNKDKDIFKKFNFKILQEKYINNILYIEYECDIYNSLGSIYNKQTTIISNIDNILTKNSIKINLLKNIFNQLHTYKIKKSKIDMSLDNNILLKNNENIVIKNYYKDFYLNKITDYFSEECRVLCRFSNRPSPESVFKNNYKYIYNWSMKKYGYINNYTFYEYLYNYKHKVCSNFDITIVLSLLKIFKPTNMLDFSAGWGDRLIGAIAYGTKYTGVDPSECMEPIYKNIINTLATNPDDYNVIKSPFEKVKLKENSYDFVFTSPPFFKLEIYEDSMAQSSSYDINEWKKKFLFPSIEKCYKYLKNNSYFTLYIVDYHIAQYIDDMFKYIEKNKLFNYIGNIYVYNEITKKIRKIFVWKKIIKNFEYIDNKYYIIKELNYNKNFYLFRGKPYTIYYNKNYLPFLKKIIKSSYIEINNIKDINDIKKNIFIIYKYNNDDNIIKKINKLHNIYFNGFIRLYNNITQKIDLICCWYYGNTINSNLYNPKIIIEKYKYKNKHVNVISDQYLIGGTKQRAIVEMLEQIKENIIIYAGPTIGYAHIALSYAAFLTKKKFVFFASDKNVTNLIKISKLYGIDVRYHNNYKQAKEESLIFHKKNNSYYISFGANDKLFNDILYKNIMKAWTIEKPKVIWIVAGSGTLLNILYKVFPKTFFNVVQVGKKIWDDMLDLKRTKLYVSPITFYNNARIKPPYNSVINYDAKLWEFFIKYGNNGDYIWNVGGDIDY